MFHCFVPLLLLVIFVLVGIIIVLLKYLSQSPVTLAPPTTENIVVSPKPSLATSVTDDWKTYTNTDIGLSLKYPNTILFNEETKGATKTALLVDVEKLSSIPEDLPMLMGRNDAMKDKARLTKGEGEDLVKIGSLYAQSEVVLGRFEICSLLLVRKVTFYPGDYRVIITLVGAKEPILASMPEFFTVDEKNCGTQTMWNRDKMALFDTTLSKKQGKGAAQEWYDMFDEILKTVTLESR